MKKALPLSAAAFALMLTFDAPAMAQSNASAEIESGDNAYASEEEWDEPLELDDDISGEELVTLFNEMLAEDEFAGLIDELLQEMLATEEPVPDWEKKGIYLPDVLAEREGGLAGQIVVGLDPMYSTLQQFDVSGAKLPDGLHTLVLRKAELGPLRETTVLPLTENTLIEMTASTERVGNAVCYTDAFSIALHSRQKPSSWTVGDAGAIGVAFGIMERTAQIGMCVVYTMDDVGILTARSYTREGEPYPALNAMAQKMEIRPASESAERIAEMKLDIEALMAAEEEAQAEE